MPSARVRRSTLADSPGVAGPLLVPVPDVFKLLPDWDDPALAWQDEALCAEVGDDDLWFPPKGGSTRTAKAICARCPVREPCLEYALANDDHFGIFGGTTERDRRRIRRERRRMEKAA